MFAIKYALSKIYYHPLASIATIALAALTSATILLATSATDSLHIAEKKTLAPLEDLGADIVMVRQMQMNNEEPGYFVGDLPDGTHKNGQSVYFKHHSEDKEFITNIFASLGVPIGIAGKFNAADLSRIDKLSQVKDKRSLLLASYNYMSEKQKKIIIPEEDIRPKKFQLDPKEEVELEQKAQADPIYRRLADESQQLMKKPEEEWTEEDKKRADELTEKMGQRVMEVYHQLRPDIFDAPPKRTKKEIKPPPPEVVMRGYTIAGMEPGVGYLKASDIIKGRYFTKQDTDAKVAILRSDFALKNNLKVGGTLKMLDTDYRVIGIGWPSLAANAPEVYVPLAALQDQLNAKGTVNIVFIKARSGADTQYLRRELARIFPDAELSDNSELARVVKPAIRGSAAVLAKFSQVLSAALAFSVIGIIVLLGISSISKRAKEIATLRAMGWPSRKVGWYFVLDIALKVAFGMVIGIVAGTIISNYLNGDAGSIPTYKMYGSSNFFEYLAGRSSTEKLAAVKTTLKLTPSLLAYVSAVGTAALIAAISGLAIAGWLQRLRPAVILRRP
ncbi:MAG: ABC transporter permease [Firmicutes bacterium]|nr:ABC transporter permease [Bacillota bacterium]